MKLHKAKYIVLALVLVIAAFCCTGCGHKEESEVRVFCYGDYMDPSVTDEFEEKTGIHVVLDTFDTNEEMYPVIKNRAGVYDVICASDYMAERMINEGLLQKIDTGSMKNYKNIGKTYLDLCARSFDPENEYAVPYQWGTLGIMYNAKKLGKGKITSWADLWDEKYSGRIIMQDSLRDTLGASLKSLGYSLNTTNEKEVAKAAQHLIDQKPLVYKYANDSARDLLIGNSADIGVVWNGELLYSQDLNKDLEFAIPKEGTEIFIDCWCIPNNAFHKENAEKFIDFMCDDDVAYTNFEYLTYSTPNEAAIKKMPEELQSNDVLFPTEKTLARCESLADLGPDGDDLYSKYWKIYKSKN